MFSINFEHEEILQQYDMVQNSKIPRWSWSSCCVRADLLSEAVPSSGPGESPSFTRRMILQLISDKSIYTHVAPRHIGCTINSTLQLWLILRTTYDVRSILPGTRYIEKNETRQLCIYMYVSTFASPDCVFCRRRQLSHALFVSV